MSLAIECDEHKKLHVSDPPFKTQFHTHQPAPYSYRSAMGPKPEFSVTEDVLVRRLHQAVGGPTALSAFDNPIATREAVLAALARQNSDSGAAARISRGDLTPLERRAVRTVTNRGAAVRSRVRQRKELAWLQEELQRKDEQVRRLEAAICALSSTMAQAPAENAAYLLDLSESLLQESGQKPMLPHLREPDASHQTPHGDHPASCSASLHGESNLTSSGVPTKMTMPNNDLFGNMFDDLNSMWQ